MANDVLYHGQFNKLKFYELMWKSTNPETDMFS